MATLPLSSSIRSHVRSNNSIWAITSQSDALDTLISPQTLSSYQNTSLPCCCSRHV